MMADTSPERGLMGLRYRAAKVGRCQHVGVVPPFPRRMRFALESPDPKADHAELQK